MPAKNGRKGGSGKKRKAEQAASGRKVGRGVGRGAHMAQMKQQEQDATLVELSLSEIVLEDFSLTQSIPFFTMAMTAESNV
eukprot:COSAG01_NODE_1338_length_10666_cov_79.971231_9_plen_81_part_00